MLQVGGKGLPTRCWRVDGALGSELVKVKVAERTATPATAVEEIAGRTGAALVQRIGHVAVLYRPSKDKRQIVLPRA